MITFAEILAADGPVLQASSDIAAYDPDATRAAIRSEELVTDEQKRAQAIALLDAAAKLLEEVDVAAAELIHDLLEELE